ncbi:MAG TPA: CRTAC1 family protein, partial [Gemmataceae bacterium]|nr:CRTAC1 family protein [Gemmataceae bacterium]
DLFVTHLTSETHTLWRQLDRGRFTDRTVAAGLTRAGWRGTGFGTVLADFDNDGALDLALVNGRVSKPEPAGNGPFHSWYAERNQLFANNGTGSFVDISARNPALCGGRAVSRGLAVGDFNNDGGLDLLVTSIAGPARLYRNVAPERGHWLMVRAIDPQCGGRDAYGAVVTVMAGDHRWQRLVQPGYSYLCSNDPRTHFGLGPAQSVDSIRVTWPDGKEEAFPGQEVDRIIVLRKGV